MGGIWVSTPSILASVKRAQDSYPCSTSDISQQVLPSPEQFSWIKKSDTWVPMWITIPEVSKACSELIKYSWKRICSRCKCVKPNLKCTPLCKCKCLNTMSPKIEYPIIPEVEPVSLGPSFSIDRYVLRNVCTKFGAFVTSVMIRLIFRPKKPD